MSIHGTADHTNKILSESVGIIGGGPSGIITAHVFLKDGFKDIQLICKDKSLGGVWARERVYPNLFTNNVHGEFRFSSLPMPPPKDASKTGGRLSGADMSSYMETYADTFLKGNIKMRLETKVIGVRRGNDGLWTVTVQDLQSGDVNDLVFSRIVLCTGGCSIPKIPEKLSQQLTTFRRPIVHSSESWLRMEEIMASSNISPDQRPIVVVGGGKSAQDISSYLANNGKKVTIVYETMDMFIGGAKPLPDLLRRSRLLGVFSPYITLNTRFERFLHTTWIGSKLVHFIWNNIANDAYKAFAVSKDSPLRLTHSLFWGLRSGDEGSYRPDSFHALVNTGEIKVVAPARVTGISADGSSVMLNNEQELKACAVILATGFTSSWDSMIDKCTAEELGIGRRQAQPKPEYAWNYTSLNNPPPARHETDSVSITMYRGLIPAKNILKRDFAANGSMYAGNSGYAFELCAHWISSYFLGDPMRLPQTVEEVLDETERYSAWIRRRFPGAYSWAHDSYGGALPFLSWPQAMDELLEDLYLPSMRSGGNWLTWLFRPIQSDELERLTEERHEKRIKSIKQ